LVIAKSDIEREFQAAREKLMEQMSSLVIAGAEKYCNKKLIKARMKNCY